MQWGVVVVEADVIPGVAPLVLAALVLGGTFVYAFVKIFLPMMGINLFD